MSKKQNLTFEKNNQTEKHLQPYCTQAAIAAVEKDKADALRPLAAEELKAKAIELGIEGPYTSWWHMFGWNTFGVLLLGPAVATDRFFDTLNKIERKLNSE